MSLWRSSSASQKSKAGAASASKVSANLDDLFDDLLELSRVTLMEGFNDASVNKNSVAHEVKQFIRDTLADRKVELNVLDQRNLVSRLSAQIWQEVETQLIEKEPVIPEHQPEDDDVATLQTPEATQILEEGITVFGADSAAPVEVKAEFEQPTEVTSSEPTAEDTEEVVEPVIPTASVEETAEKPNEADNAEANKLQAVTEKAAPRAATQTEIVKERVQPLLLERIDISAAVTMDRLDLARDISDIVADILIEERIQLNQREQRELIEALMHDMLGLGPLEPLLADEAITDIMVNGPKQVYVEKKGKLVLSECQFRDNAHVMSIAGRIVSHVGRRVDESNPLVDARLADGSRVNIIIPPLAIDGPSISIRKFAKQKITLDTMAKQGNLSNEAATVLRVAGRCRLNILISGGTGSGKTTLLNAISQLIDPGERIVTIEDAAELQMQQPHVVRLETRSANLEGGGEITMRDLLKNSLRMRPDRIILGEIRGGEAIDMLQAMNTGHDGSLSTIHANRPREALTRLENMVGMSGVNLPAKAVKMQIASAVDLIVQVSRMRDGMRRITYISEVVGMEEDVITMQDLFWYEFQGEDKGGRLLGDFKSSGLRPHFAPRAAYFGLEKMLLGAM
ncbi:MAG: Flp pilus assembly complex ATPase component TadA [Sneathiellales bacterium]|nr:Flp pilus assembly complex ATPase component TadA [Sneathiellales bacterium]